MVSIYSCSQTFPTILTMFAMGAVNGATSEVTQGDRRGSPIASSLKWFSITLSKGIFQLLDVVMWIFASRVKQFIRL
jgi:hypothetical protein